jgi:hypothetical protein
MMLMLLLTELARLEVNLSVEADGLHVQAPAGALSEELRLAMAEHRTALLHYAACPTVETIDGPGVLTGTRQETDPLCFGTRHGERLRYKIGVRLLQDGVERFYLPGTLRQAERKEDGRDEMQA